MWVIPEDLFVGTSGKTDFNGLAPGHATTAPLRRQSDRASEGASFLFSHCDRGLIRLKLREGGNEGGREGDDADASFLENPKLAAGSYFKWVPNFRVGVHIYYLSICHIVSSVDGIYVSMCRHFILLPTCHWHRLNMPNVMGHNGDALTVSLRTLRKRVAYSPCSSPMPVSVGKWRTLFFSGLMFEGCSSASALLFLRFMLERSNYKVIRSFFAARMTVLLAKFPEYKVFFTIFFCAKLKALCP